MKTKLVRPFGVAVALLLGLTLAMAPAIAQEKKPAEKPAAVKLPEPLKFESTDTVADYLTSISLTIKAGWAQGSGTCFTRDNVTFIWTAGHVVDGLRKEREIIDDKGVKRTAVEFNDARVLQILQKNGRTVGRVELDAKVVKYSSFDHGEDLALLMVRMDGFLKQSTKFYLESLPTGQPKIPGILTKLYHVGSLHGEFGSNSVTEGNVSQTGRVLDGKTYDQTTVPAHPGSSGGGVFLQGTDGKSDLRYVGMIVRGTAGSFNLMVPVRRIKAWAEKEKLMWALNENVPMPSLEDIERIPVESTGTHFGGSEKASKQSIRSNLATKDRFGFLLRPMGSDGAALMEGPIAPQDPLIFRVIRELKK